MGEQISRMEQTSSRPATSGVDDDVQFEIHTQIGISSGPLSASALGRAKQEAQWALERAFFKASLDANVLALVELFALLVESAPEMLRARWAALLDIIAAEERFWVFSTATLGEIEEGLAEPFPPYLNRRKLAAEWTGLLEHAERVGAAQKSGERHALVA
jgi:hypothetical protein